MQTRHDESGTALVVREVTPADTADLRRLVLRNGRPVPLPGDDAPAFHVGVYDADLLVGTGNVRREGAPWVLDEPAWRLRGMATSPTRRSEGIGGLVLATLVAYCSTHGGGVLWCHARTTAQDFYERAGFRTFGDPWVDAEIGPHVRMLCKLG